MARKEKLNEKDIPYGARQRMPIWYGGVWSTRGIAAAINVVLCMNIAFYCTDIVGLVMGLAGYDGLAATQSASANSALYSCTISCRCFCLSSSSC